MHPKRSLAAALTGACCVAAQTTPTVKVANGTLQGGKCSSSNVNYFLSIPYAEPPVGNARFTSPQSFNQAYNGTRDATKAAPACTQFGTTFVEVGPQSEDCLFLDIWVPANKSSSSSADLPVKVWLYGGSNAAGGISNPLYDGCNSLTDAIQVNVNYRLGPLGWMALQSAGLTGNYGLQDQLLALQWVQENIEAFGGDKTKVMLYGQSAGAIDTFTISTLAQAPSLIQAAVMESGGGVDIPTIAEAQGLYKYYATQLNCSISDVNCLRSKTVEDFNNTAMNLPNFGSDSPSANTLLDHDGYGVLWGPVVDGVVVPDLPAKVGVRVASVFGSTTNEGAIFVLGQYMANVFNLNQSSYDEFLTDNFGSYASLVNTTYALANFSNSVFAAMSEVMTDYGYKCPARRGLLGAKPGVPVYAYTYNHTLSCTWLAGVPQAALPLIGATHTSELPLVFGDFENLAGANCSLNATERALSRYIQDAWTSMAASKNPGSGWPQYSASAPNGIIFNDNATVGKVDYSGCDFWDQLNLQIRQTAANQANGSQTAPPNSTATSTAPGAGKTNDGARASAWSAQFISFVAVVGLLLLQC